MQLPRAGSSVQGLFKEVLTPPGESLGSQEKHLPFVSVFSCEYLKHRDQQLHTGPGVAAEMWEMASLGSLWSDFIEIDFKRC